MSLARPLAPIPVTLRTRTFPATPPFRTSLPDPLPTRALIAEAVIGPDGRALAGAYLGDGPVLDGVGGRFLGPAAPDGLVVPGSGPLRDLPGLLDRIVWRPCYESRFAFIGWDPAAFFASLAFTFRHDGTWAIIFTDLVGGRELVNYYRSPIIFEPRTNANIDVKFGPRKKPDARDFVGTTNKQWPGVFISLRRAVTALSGERVDDLATACRLFDIPAPPQGPATVETLPARITALRDLYRAVRAEADRWPGVSLTTLSSAAGITSGSYLAARVPQLLLRTRDTLRVPTAAIGAGIEAASVGARTGVFQRRIEVPGIDVDLTACYPVASALAGTHRFLTHEVSAHHVGGARSLRALGATVRRALAAGLLEHPELWRSLAFLVKVRPSGDILTVHVDLLGTEATLTTPVAPGSTDLWLTGFDLAAAVIADLDRGGEGQLPEIVEAWTFTFGARLPGLRPVTFPGWWCWDPRRADTYRSRNGRAWGNLWLLLAAMRMEAKADPALTPATRIRHAGMLKVASVSGAFGSFLATTPIEGPAGRTHRVITAEGVVTLDRGTPERPGSWAFPPAGALVEGSGRLLLTLLMHEVHRRGGSFAQVDTDGGFIIATLLGGEI